MRLMKQIYYNLMMATTTLGNIKSSYGKTFNTAIANTYSSIVLSGSNLPENSFIISSNIDSNFEDTGTYSLIITDNNGLPVRLTYTIKEGNGFVKDKDNADILFLDIDNKYIVNSTYGLSVDLSNFLNDSISINENGKFTVNINNINHANSNNKGIVKIDDESIKIDENKLYIDTESLIKANNNTSTLGTISSSDDIISVNNGIVSLDQSKLPLSNEENFGLSTGDQYTIINEDDNSLSVNTQNLERGNNIDYGIIDVDNNKIISNDGKLSVNTNSLNHATYNKKGTIQIDNVSITLNENNQISINNYNKIVDDIYNLENELNNMKEKFLSLKEDILSQINE